MPPWNLIAPLFSWIMKVYQVPSTKVVLFFLIKNWPLFFFVKMNCIQLQVYLFLRSTSDWPGLAYWIQEIIFQNQCYICFNILLICGCIFLSLQLKLCRLGNRIMLFDMSLKQQHTSFKVYCKAVTSVNLAYSFYLYMCCSNSTV